MADTIDRIAKSNALMPLSVDNMTERYKTDNGIYVFPSPSFWTIEKNLFYLLRHSVEKNFESQYIMRPEYMSYDEYGTVLLAPLLMIINNVASIEEFELSTVIVPKLDAIIEIASDRVASKDVKDMTEISW